MSSAGEISGDGLGQVRDHLGPFPNARYFAVGDGANDLGMGPEVERTSHRIIEDPDRMVRAIREGGRYPILLEVPHANESMFPRRVADTSVPETIMSPGPGSSNGGAFPLAPEFSGLLTATRPLRHVIRR